MFVTRKAEFSASHCCRIDSLNDHQNHELFGEEANPNGHGHNYVLEVSVEGDPDPVTGMVIDLKELKEIVDKEVITPMDHRFLNREVPPFDHVIPTTANIAREIWRRVESGLKGRHFDLARVRLFETPDFYVDVLREDLVV
ncbi:MAG TPA: 6-carboxytetrahydropterin synthase [Bryobacteraceae bacterium]|jgi:6-pyruvoyltetrahydropterin/6-carboxytetrahydropterin synthase